MMAMLFPPPSQRRAPHGQNYAEWTFDGYHFAHIAAWQEARRLARIAMSRVALLAARNRRRWP